MPTLQEYFDSSQQKNKKKIFLEGNKIGKVNGNVLIIEDYQQLDYVYISDLPNLTKLTIKDCNKLENLELHLDKKLEVELIGNVNLKNIKTNTTSQTPLVIYKDKQPKTFCFNCVLHAISLIGVTVLAYLYVKEKMKNKNNDQKKLKLINNG